MEQPRPATGVEFGIFDHLDHGGGPVDAFYRDRLDLIGLAERMGFRSYHLAEHHLTPLGLAPSPTVFLSAVAQRTRTLRFGPMIFAAPLYNPVRLLEEICMLDQLSEGRLEMGFGRGAVAAEVRFLGVDPASAESKYRETVEFVLTALKKGHVKVPKEDGTYDAPLVIPPYQRPHPPLWYGAHSAASVQRAAQMGMNVLSLDSAEVARPCFDGFFEAWHDTHGDEAAPKAGVSRLLVVAADREQALERARRGYLRWQANFTALSSRMGFHHKLKCPPTFDDMHAAGRAFAGTPDDVAAYVSEQLAASGANFFVGQFAFGSLHKEEMAESIERFGREVMPRI